MNISPQEFVSAAAAIIREATYGDIVQLAVHYSRMFEEIRQSKGQRIAITQPRAIGKAYAEKPEEQLSAGICSTRIADIGGQAAASGANCY